MSETAHDEDRSSERSLTSKIGLALGPALFLSILLFCNFDSPPPADPPEGFKPTHITAMAAVAILMAVWWITNAIPLAATALLPLVLYPALGIESTKAIAPVYTNDIIFLFLGGFMIALAMERWGLHKRIALGIIRAVGGGPSRLVLSFMLATAFLSMWISNTATSIMMLAIGLAIIKAEEAAFGVEKTKNLSVALLLGIAYAASIGGIATLVGTPPNISFARLFTQFFPEAEEISFGRWILFGLPITVVMLAIAWFMLTRVFFKSPADLELSTDVIETERKKLGSIKFEEIVVLIVFILTAVLWVFRKTLTFGKNEAGDDSAFKIQGWSDLFENGPLFVDGTIAIMMALILFLVPVRSPQTGPKKFSGVLDGEVFKHLPWHIILLFGGGFALAKGFQISGLSEFVGSGFKDLKGVEMILIISIVCFALTFLTELTSNLATTEMIMPILAGAAVTMEINPLLLMVPAAVSASCAFMMPVATPPNAVVFASGRIKIGQMVRVGIVLNLIGVAVITLLFFTIGRAVFQIEPGQPEWAREISTGSEE
ncbi:MAG: sodium-dependent dicarboxylate transporter 2/3/5 [Verrucomicrobiales bacterium]|jgi:sodium-dependent dicarboxylate transporter 2/3/5